MKSICITGAAQPALKYITDLLHSSGMKTPQAAKRDDTIDIAFWHEQVMAMATEESGDIQPILNPGRLWDQLASEIFVANIKSKIWGWTDWRSTWLLDFWLNYDPRLNFILVCNSPQQMLASAIASETSGVSVEAVMNAWQAHHQELLRFHHRHPQRSLLVDAHDCAVNSRALVEHCAAQWKLPLTAPADTVAFYGEYDSLALYLAQQLCLNYPETASLQQEIAATIACLGETELTVSVAMSEEIIADYRRLRDRTVELQQVRAAIDELAALKTFFDDTITVHAQQQNDADAKLKKAIHSCAEQTTRANELQAQIELIRKTQTENSELLLLELHQAHLESEQYFQQYQETFTNLQAAEARFTGEAHKFLMLNQASNEQAAFASEQQARIESLTQERNSLVQQLTELQAQLDALTQANTALESTLNERRNALQNEFATLTQACDAQAQLAAERQAKIEQLDQTQAENCELLLLEVHQAHLESEHYFQQYQETFTNLQAAEARFTGEMHKFLMLNQASNEQAAFASEQQARIESLTQERNSLVQQLTELQAQLDALTQANTALGSTLNEQRNALQNEFATLTQACDAQAQLAAERQAKIEQLDQTQAESSELLLLEVHQAHLESEHYFQQYQETLTQLQAAQARWQRLQLRDPAYVDYETIEILPAIHSEGRDVAWRLTNVSIAGRDLPFLEFNTPLEQGFAGLTFFRSADGSSPLTRWPAAANQQNELALLPVGTRSAIQQRGEILLELATRDWDLVQILIPLLVSSLENPDLIKARADLQSEEFRTGLCKLGQIIEKFPATFRFDSVSLKHEQINPDYEHLWLRFDNPSFGDKRWPKFEFRLACGNVRPSHFGNDPKLEFPESNQALFDAWFAESSDDFGAKLELRFAVPEAMDLAVWQRLSKNDHAFISAIVGRLPSILGVLQGNGVQLNRPWDAWAKIAYEMQSIIALCTAPPVAPIHAMPVHATTQIASVLMTEKPPQPMEAAPRGRIKATPHKHATKTDTIKPPRTSQERKSQ